MNELDILKVLETADKLNIEEPSSAEEFMNMSPYEKLLLRSKWAIENQYNFDELKQKIDFFDKPIEKPIYKVIDKNNDKLIKQYDLKKDIKKDFNLSDNELDYLIRFRNKNIKNPKYQIFNRLKIIVVRLYLKENDYIEK